MNTKKWTDAQKKRHSEKLRKWWIDRGSPRFWKNGSRSECPSWKGGRHVAHGYVFIHSPEHPDRDSHDYVREHRLVMEEHIGRFLKPGEVVHHINGDRSDNRIENLMLFSSDREHHKHHKQLKKGKVYETA